METYIDDDNDDEQKGCGGDSDDEDEVIAASVAVVRDVKKIKAENSILYLFSERSLHSRELHNQFTQKSPTTPINLPTRDVATQCTKQESWFFLCYDSDSASGSASASASGSDSDCADQGFIRFVSNENPMRRN